MSEVAKFYAAKRAADVNERILLETKENLKQAYEDLVSVCPHSEALDWQYLSGVYRICTICGLIDMASQGGTPGDEYNYGSNGHPNREFWKDTKTIQAKSQKEHWDCRNRYHHDYVVEDGKVVNRSLF